MSSPFFFDNTPAVALAGDLADVVARRESVMTELRGDITTAMLARHMRTGLDINRAVRMQLGF